jgi:hypothetical protein
MDRPATQHHSEDLPAAARPRGVYSIDQILGTSTTPADEGHLHQSKDGKRVRTLWILRFIVTNTQNGRLDDEAEVMFGSTWSMFVDHIFVAAYPYTYKEIIFNGIDVCVTS